MARTNWTFVLEGRTHVLELEHGFWSSRHRILLDDDCLFDKKVMLEFGAEVPFELDGHTCLMSIDVPGRLSYAYAFTIDGTLIPENADPAKNPLTSFATDATIDREITRSFALRLMRDASRRQQVPYSTLDNLVREAGELRLDDGVKLRYIEENYHLVGPPECVTSYFGYPSHQ